MGEWHKISDENISHIIRVFLAGVRHPGPIMDKAIIADGPAGHSRITTKRTGDHPPDTWCEWKQVFKQRTHILSWLKQGNHEDLNALAAILTTIWETHGCRPVCAENRPTIAEYHTPR